MNPVARARHVLARRPWLYWSAVLALAGLAGWTVAGAAADVEQARRAWGATREVVVATEDLVPGEPLSGHVDVRSRPAPAVADAAVTSVPPGAMARQHVAAGETLVEADIAPAGGPQALIPTGWAAIAVAEAVPVGAAIGDRVTLVGGGVVLAAEGLVVGQATDALLVAVPADEAPPVADASSAGELALLLLP
jgi:hypothetical protein